MNFYKAPKWIRDIKPLEGQALERQIKEREEYELAGKQVVTVTIQQIRDAFGCIYGVYQCPLGSTGGKDKAWEKLGLPGHGFRKQESVVEKL